MSMSEQKVTLAPVGTTKFVDKKTSRLSRNQVKSTLSQYEIEIDIEEGTEFMSFVLVDNNQSDSCTPSKAPTNHPLNHPLSVHRQETRTTSPITITKFRLLCSSPPLLLGWKFLLHRRIC